MLERIIELTAETLGANAAEITAETSFMDDLHADSLDLFRTGNGTRGRIFRRDSERRPRKDHHCSRCNELPDRASGIRVTG